MNNNLEQIMNEIKQLEEYISNLKSRLKHTNKNF